jgi:hypothetical protein
MRTNVTQNTVHLLDLVNVVTNCGISLVATCLCF